VQNGGVQGRLQAADLYRRGNRGYPGALGKVSVEAPRLRRVLAELAMARWAFGGPGDRAWSGFTGWIGQGLRSGQTGLQARLGRKDDARAMKSGEH
jgi:hypothetical protein